MEQQVKKILRSWQITGICLLILSACNFSKDKIQQDLILKIGLVADPQYENKEPSGIRYYKESLWKLAEAIDSFNYHHVDFVQTLGDVINGGWESFDSILPVYNSLDKSIKNYHLLGNHEFAVDEQYLNQLTTKLQRASY